MLPNPEYFQEKFMRAVRNNKINEAKKYLLGGANVNDRDYTGQTPLWVAVHYANVEMTEFLLAEGTDPKKPTENGVSPLAMIEYNLNFYTSDPESKPAAALSVGTKGITTKRLRRRDSRADGRESFEKKQLKDGKNVKN